MLWSLRIGLDTLDLTPHRIYIAYTLGLGALRRRRHYSSTDVGLVVVPEWFGTRRFELHDRQTGKRIFQFVGQHGHRYQDEIERQLRAAGF